MEEYIVKEDQLLYKALNLLEENGAGEAYEYILSNKEFLEDYSSQLYNYLYCLSSVIGKKDESLAWMREALIDEGFWYRPAVFDDEDLDNIRDGEAFLRYKAISTGRYYEALETASTLCTWREVKDAKIALILHGNQQNMYMGVEYWQFFEDEGYQVEYVQSAIIDSHDLYRWEDEGDTQLDKVIDSIPWDMYNVHALCGFSAGCNEILKTLVGTSVKCQEIVLQSPWIPMIDENLEKLMIALEKVRIRIICGSNDKDCLPYAKKLAEEAEKRGLDCRLQVINGLGHKYPTGHGHHYNIW